MGEPAPKVPEALFDDTAIDRAYHVHRARRRARIERVRATRRARIRFWLTLIVLLALSVLLSISIWREVQRLFGL